ncbi:MAG: hypothetical protein MUF18_09610 [Fimbriiglobus sp.]|nr:hypothetical protein [Fimbriiglobus sp.]
MTTIRMETIPEPTREMIRSLARSPEGVVFEENGRPAYRLLPYPTPTTAEPEWTAADNDRRCDLIDKDLDGLLTPDERAELSTLQRRLSRYIDAVAPLPLEPLRKLHQQLLDKAARANGGVSS